MYQFIEKTQRKQIKSNHFKLKWLTTNLMLSVEKKDLRKWRTEQDNLI